MGSDESHFNVTLIVRDKDTVSTNHNLFEEKGEPKRNRAEALLLTPYRWAKPDHSLLKGISCTYIRANKA